MKFLINNYAYPGFCQRLIDLGHEVLGYTGKPDEFNWWCHLMQWGKNNFEYDEILRNQILEHKPDVYICGKGWHESKRIFPETVEWIQKKVKCSIYWSIDDPDFIPIFMRLGMWRGYDIALTCSGSSIPDYEKVGLETHLFWPAWDEGVWQSQYVPDRDKEFDFLMVGTPYTITKIPRRNIAATAINIGMKTGIYGGVNWLMEKPDHFAAGHPSFELFYKGFFNDRNHLPQLFAKSRMNFSNHIHTAFEYLNDRVPLVLGSRQFLFLDRQPGLEKYFEDGKHVVYFDTLEDLAEKMQYYKTHIEERELIANNAHDLIMREHTYSNRVDTLLNILKKRGIA